MQITIDEMMNILIHRYPFLLVDKVIDYEKEKYVVACKNVSVNEPWAKGHFPGDPIYPGALIVESSAQAGAFLFYDRGKDDKSKKGLLAGVENFKFVKVVKPGDQLIIKVELVSKFGNLVKVKVKATVEDERVAEGGLTYVLG